MKKWDVTITRYGFAIIEAETPEKAEEIGNSLTCDEISWSDDYEVTDVIEGDEDSVGYIV